MPNPALVSRSNAAGVVIVAAALLSIGLVMVGSTLAGLGQPLFAWPPWRTALGRQTLFSLTSLIVILGAARGVHRWFRWNVETWFQPSILLFLAASACLAAVLIPGVGSEAKGASRWLVLGPAGSGLGFQPSELGKVALVVFLAAFLSARWNNMGSFWRVTAPAAAAIGLLAGLVAVEDFGTGALLAGVGGLMLLIGGTPWWHLGLLSLPGAAGMVYIILTSPYRLERLTTFRNIWADPLGSGYHPIQSLVTIASGGFAGLGLGQGIQKCGYLPEAHNDFIFSVICEETGLIGAGLVIALYVLLLWFGGRTVWTATRPFERMLAAGVTLVVVLQAVMNIAVVTVSAPTKGISLPLVSAGGSGVLFLGAALGLLVAVAREAETCPETP